MKQKDREINFFKKTSLGFSGSTDKLDHGIKIFFKTTEGLKWQIKNHISLLMIVNS